MGIVTVITPLPATGAMPTGCHTSGVVKESAYCSTNVPEADGQEITRLPPDTRMFSAGGATIAEVNGVELLPLLVSVSEELTKERLLRVPAPKPPSWRSLVRWEP